MKLMLLAQEPTPRPGEVASGNAIRIQQLKDALTGAGHSLEYCWLAGPGRAGGPGAFHTREQLHAIIGRARPQALLVTYWELLGLLPFESELPVVLDHVAPRPLEELYENPATVRANLRRLGANLARCDLVMVGNDLQQHLLVHLLLETGFDLRANLPVITVPLGAQPLGPPQSNPEQDGWLLVAGGVSWPWREEQNWLAGLAQGMASVGVPGRLVQFAGAYRWHAEANDHLSPAAPEPDASQRLERRALLPYAQYGEFLTRQAHIGVELADENIERRYSQSFRSLEFLRHGLPLICNDYLPIAHQVQRHDAGWLVRDAADLPALWAHIATHPQQWRQKSAAALRLVQQELTPARSVAPLLRWLESPSRAQRLPHETRADQQQPVLTTPPLRERLLRQARLARQVALSRLFARQAQRRGVIFVTRADLFPPDHGAAVRTIASATAIAQSGTPVGIVTDEPGCWYSYSNGRFQPRRYPWWARVLTLPGPLLKLLHYSKDIPQSNAFLYQPLTDGSFFWRILAACRYIPAGVLQAEFPAYALPCIRVREALGLPVVLVEHNVEYERMRAQVPDLTTAQYHNLRAIEISLCRQCDAVVCVSDNDRQKLIADGVEPGLLHTIAHGVNLQASQTAQAVDVRSRFAIPPQEALLVYHGTFSYPPNRQALQVFADILLPGLERRGLRCHVLAVGRQPPARSPHPRIYLAGSVTAVAPWLKAADLAVIPLTDGGGTRMKIVDCFASGLAVVSTSKGIEGIPIEPGRHALVIDDWEEMIDAIATLLGDDERRAQLAAAGAELAATLDWQEAGRKYREIYATLS